MSVISRIQALNYKCLRYVDQELSDFNILVGPNASGKTTFLDVVSFLGDLVSEGLEFAVLKRGTDLRDLLWMGQGESFELAVELKIPEERRASVNSGKYENIRYEVNVGFLGGEIAILGERALLLSKQPEQSPIQLDFFPSQRQAPDTIMSPGKQQDRKFTFHKTLTGNDNYYSETGGYKPAFKLGAKKSTLANLPEDENKFPVSTWLKQTLIESVQSIMLNSSLMRNPSPPVKKAKTFQPDGSNLPFVIDNLKNHGGYREWIAHLGTAIPELKSVRVVERPEDKHKYLVVEQKDGFESKSWMLSDGTLRIMALTLLAYLPGKGGVYLIEEPENGVHPTAVEAVFDSLSSVYNSQILVATHSPVFLSLVKPEQVLCFAKTPEGTTDVVRGDKHPALKDWKGIPNLKDLFAAGVLG